jgi:hypothetical protein
LEIRERVHNIGQTLLKWLDRAYFKLKRHLFPPDEVSAFADGYVAGFNAGRGRVLRELQDKSLYNFSSAELRIGYDYARHVAEKVEPACH